MMLKEYILFTAATAYSQEKDTQKAVKDVLEKAFDKFDSETADLAFVFSSFQTYDHPALVKAIHDSGKIKNLIGGTSSGEINGDKSLSNSVTVMLLSSQNVQFKTARQELSLEAPVEGAKKLAEQLKIGGEGKPKLIVVVGVGVKGAGFPGEAVVEALQSAFGEDIPVVGGGCGDELTFTQPLLYFQNQTFSCINVAAVAFYGDFSFGIGVRHGWEPIGSAYKITKVEGYILKELEGKKPRDLLIDYFGEDVIEKFNDPKTGIPLIYPLCFEVEGTDEVLIRTPVQVKPDGSVTTGGLAKVGQKVSLAIGSPEQVLKATEYSATKAKDSLGGEKPSAVLFFDCISRKLVLGKDANKEVEILQKYFASVPIAGMYTYGEVAPAGGSVKKAFFHNQSAVILALA